MSSTLKGWFLAAKSASASARGSSWRATGRFSATILAISASMRGNSVSETGSAKRKS